MTRGESANPGEWVNSAAGRPAGRAELRPASSRWPRVSVVRCRLPPAQRRRPSHSPEGRRPPADRASDSAPRSSSPSVPSCQRRDHNPPRRGHPSAELEEAGQRSCRLDAIAGERTSWGFRASTARMIRVVEAGQFLEMQVGDLGDQQAFECARQTGDRNGVLCHLEPARFDYQRVSGPAPTAASRPVMTLRRPNRLGRRSSTGPASVTRA